VSDETYSRGERIFLLFAGTFGFLACSGFVVLFLWWGFFYHGSYARHFPAYRLFLGIVPFALLAVQAAKLAIAAYHGKVLD